MCSSHQQSSCLINDHGSVINSPHVGYINANHQSCFVYIIWLNFSTICFSCIMFSSVSCVWCGILIYTESWFIILGFTRSPQVDHWVINQLNLSPHHVHVTQIYIFTYIDTQYTMVKLSQRIKTTWGVSPNFVGTFKS